MRCREVLVACFLHLFIYFFYYLLFTPPPLYFSIGVKLNPGYTRLKFSSRGDSDKERPISVLYLLSKGSLPEDIIKSNEGASLTIC